MFSYTITLTVVFTAVLSNAFQFRQTLVSRKAYLNMADIVDTAVGAGSFKTLAAALTAANLVSTLKGPGPFTVFAPTDEAFAKLPPGTVESLLKDIPTLTKILTNHVVSGAVKAEKVVTLSEVTTLSQNKLKVVVGAAGVKIDNANVIKTDIVCDNGVIHVIDSVMVPQTTSPAPAKFDPKNEAGVSGPFGFFDPLGLCPDNKRDFSKFRESELKHGRIGMIAVLGMLVGEKAGFLFGDSISGPAIYQYQQAESIFNAWSLNVIGLTLAVEGYNIVNGWEAPGESEGLASLKSGYVNGDLKFDPLGFKPTSASELKAIQTKEINNGRLAMLAAAGIVAQELVTGTSVF